MELTSLIGATAEQVVDHVHPDEWWHSDGRDDFIKLVKLMQYSGLDNDLIATILATAYTAIANEYGD